MPSNKKYLRHASRPTKHDNKHADFAKLLEATRKAKSQPVDRGMIFVSYLLEQELNRHPKKRGAGLLNKKPRS